MSKTMKSLRDIAVVSLAMGTAYGLGILSCIYVELKLLAEYSTKINQNNHKDDSTKEKEEV